MTTPLSDHAWDLLKELEGLRLKAYPDEGGVWTIGYGHTKGVKRGDRCTREQADLWLAQDIEWAVRAVETYVDVPLNDNQFSALVIFVFNIGVEAFRTSTLVRVLNQGEYNLVPVQLQRWVYVKSFRSPGLENRRDAEEELWKTPV